MGRTSIEWASHSWPVVNGCRRISPGCGGGTDGPNKGGCYAERLIATRLSKTPKYEGLATFGLHGPRWTGKSRLWAPALDEPLKLQKPAQIFVADMGDLFFEEVSNEDIAAVYGVMAACPQHTFFVLTKRTKRMREWYAWVEREDGARRACLILHHAQRLSMHRSLRHTTQILSQPWPLQNVYIGASVEDQKRELERLPDLIETRAALRFLSVEPQLEQIDLHGLVGINYVICGGESGPGARPFDLAWARDIISQCRYAGVSVFMKQIGDNPYDSDSPFGDAAHMTKVRSLTRKGGNMSEWPEDLRVRDPWPTPEFDGKRWTEFPEARP